MALFLSIYILLQSFLDAFVFSSVCICCCLTVHNSRVLFLDIFIFFYWVFFSLFFSINIANCWAQISLFTFVCQKLDIYFLQIFFFFYLVYIACICSGWLLQLKYFMFLFLSSQPVWLDLSNYFFSLLHVNLNKTNEMNFKTNKNAEKNEIDRLFLWFLKFSKIFRSEFSSLSICFAGAWDAVCVCLYVRSLLY